MRHIYQRCESDCFPTCIAIVTGISHRRAVELVHPFHKKGTDYSTHDEEGIGALRRLGYRVRKRYFSSFWEITSPAILIMEFENDPDNSHVVVWDPCSCQILEPYRKYKYISYYTYEKAFRYALLIS